LFIISFKVVLLNHYGQTNLDPNLDRQPLSVIIISSPFLQRGSQYTPTHHHPLAVDWSVGGEETLQEDYYYPSPLDHVIEIQDVWVTSQTFQLQLVHSKMNEAPGCSSPGVVQAYLEE